MASDFKSSRETAVPIVANLTSKTVFGRSNEPLDIPAPPESLGGCEGDRDSGINERYKSF